MSKTAIIAIVGAMLLGPQAFSQNIEVTAPEAVEAVNTETASVEDAVIPGYMYLPTIFDSYDLHPQGSNLEAQSAAVSDGNPLKWATDRENAFKRFRALKQGYMFTHPDRVTYNINTLPEPPKQFLAVVDPVRSTIVMQEVVPEAVPEANVAAPEVDRINWLHSFDGLVQFSQAYISPNWYQGGNNNLNALINAIYNVKLNQAFHPNLLFETTLQYKLGLNSAPDDSLRSYSISEDLLQLNSKFGIRAAKRWYYSATLQFKTQLLNNYKTNTRDMKASFLSPGELNVGLGMTYEYVTPSKKFNVNVSLAPISYNLKICTNEKIDQRLFGIEEGKKTASQIGSNIDCKLSWQIAHNISFVSRLTAFTDYHYLQSDWENTLSFSINRFLSTQIYVHLRYDTQTPRIPDSSWSKLQLKEILSFGFAYKFSR